MLSNLSKECSFWISQILLESVASSWISSLDSRKICNFKFLESCLKSRKFKKKSWFLTAEILELLKILDSCLNQDLKVLDSWFLSRPIKIHLALLWFATTKFRTYALKWLVQMRFNTPGVIELTSSLSKDVSTRHWFFS